MVSGHIGIYSHRYALYVCCCVMEGCTNINRHCMFGPISYKGLLRYALCVPYHVTQEYTHIGMNALYVWSCIIEGCTHIDVQGMLRTLLPYPLFFFCSTLPLINSLYFPKQLCFYFYVIHTWFYVTYMVLCICIEI